MARNFTLISNEKPSITLVNLEKALATVIPAGSMVTLDSGWLAVLATAASTKICFTQNWADWTTTALQVVADIDVDYKGTASGNFAKANRGIAYDIAVSSTVQTVNLSGTTVWLLKVSAADETVNGVTTSATTVIVTIPWSKHLFGG